MSDCDHKCTECDRKPCIEFSPKMAVPRELQTDYGIMVTAHILMAVSIDSLGRKNEQLQAENAKLRELAKQMHICLTRPKVYDGEQPYLTATECPYFTEGACDYNACGFEQRMQELDIEVDR